MKQYRLIKPFLYFTGEIVEPQSLDSGNGYCWANSFMFDPSFVESNTEYFEEVKPERWKPEEDDFVWYVDAGGIVRSFIWTLKDYSDNLYNFYNCFQTEEQAEEAAKRVNQTLMDYQDELMEGGK